MSFTIAADTSIERHMRHLVPILMVTTVWLSGVIPLRAQSLGEIARKEEERRKSVKSGSTRVYTNKDLGGASAPSASAVEAPVPEPDGGQSPDATDEQSAAAETEATPNDSARDEAFWRKRMNDLTSTLQRNLTYIEALQSRINALTTDFVNRDDPAQRSTIEADRQTAIAELERLQTQVQDDRKAITDLKDEARRAGVPPGWLR